MKKSLILLILIIGLFVLTICLPKDFSSHKEVLFRVEKGEGSKTIAQNLEKEDLIWWGQLFRAYVLVRNISDEMQAGTYRLSPKMSILTIAEKFAAGDVAKEKITIIEGWNLKNIAEYLKERLMLGDVQLPSNLEGYLFPDTYLVRREASLNEIIKQMQDNFQQKTAPFNEEITGQKKTLTEIITMASLIEKEVRTKEDKKIVSGIFWKRMKISQPLESCATIAYIKGVNQWRYSFDDTRIESPYNTYLNVGLPPGPICNPGLQSIEAALFPQESPYWYWLSTPEGETIFSKTLAEHNAAKAKYLK